MTTDSPSPPTDRDSARLSIYRTATSASLFACFFGLFSQSPSDCSCTTISRYRYEHTCFTLLSSTSHKRTSTASPSDPVMHAIQQRRRSTVFHRSLSSDIGHSSARSCTAYISVHLELLYSVPGPVGRHATSQQLSLSKSISCKIIIWTCSSLDDTMSVCFAVSELHDQEGDTVIHYTARGKILMNVKYVFLVKVCLLFS
jgi:hypothetical protein